jgi:AcrR family transcriptional regulator
MKNAIDKKQQILKSAIGLFNHTHDVKRVSLETIAREAHVSPTTIYNYFGTRENLLYEVIKILVQENMESRRKLIHSNISFPEKLIGLTNVKLNLATNVNNEILDTLVTQDKSIAPFIDEIYQSEIRPLWQEIIAEGKIQGYVDASLDDETLLVYMDILKAGSVNIEQLKNWSDNMRLIQQLSHIIFYGFMKKEVDFFRKDDTSATG